MTDIVRLLREPPFGTDTSERYIMARGADEIERLRAALRNVMGHLDTPIGRRKVGIDPNADWLLEARELIQHKEG